MFIEHIKLKITKLNILVFKDLDMLSSLLLSLKTCNDLIDCFVAVRSLGTQRVDTELLSRKREKCKSVGETHEQERHMNK